MGKWHGNLTPIERVFRINQPKPGQYVEFPASGFRAHSLESYDGVAHLKKLKNLMDHPSEANASSTRREFLHLEYHMVCTHLEFIRLGRPTYLVSKELYDVCGEMEISPDDRLYIYEKLPYWTFCLAFEKGIGFHAYNSEDDTCLENIFVRGVLINASGLFGTNLGDLGKSDRLSNDGIMLIQDTRACGPGIAFGTGRMSDEAKSNGIGDYFMPFFNMVAALLMLWRSRPEFLVEAMLPRSERYQFKGDRSLIRTWKFPDKLIVRKPHGESEPTGRHVKAHWRAGHFRHYRHERYAREPDGSVKVEFIAPCVIHADELVKESTRGT